MTAIVHNRNHKFNKQVQKTQKHYAYLSVLLTYSNHTGSSAREG